MREVAFLAASRRLATQAHTVPRLAGRARRNPLAVRPPLFKRGGSTESIPVPTPVVSTESERKRCDDTEVFGNILSTLELGGGLLEEETVVAEAIATEEETGEGVLALEIPEAIANVDTYDGPLRREEEEIAMEEAKEAEVALEAPKVALEEVTREAQPKVAEEKKKKKKNKGKKVGEAESSHHRKEKKNKKKMDDDEDEEARKERNKKEKEEKKMRRREERRLKKEEEAREKAASPEIDGESTYVREDKGETI